ncbi:MAG: hypothetical protein RL368_2157 [Pseudomonadota bacterium]|jgi:hypothetical protein
MKEFSELKNCFSTFKPVNPDSGNKLVTAATVFLYRTQVT